MKEITIKDFANKYPDEYNDLLFRLGIPSLNSAVLKVASIRAIKIYSIKGKLYYSCLQDHGIDEINRQDLLGHLANDKSYECYLLMLKKCDNDLEITYPNPDGLMNENCITYIIHVKDKMAYYTLNVSEGNILSPDFVSLVLHIIDKQIDIHTTCIRVSVEDQPFLKRLRKLGFSIHELNNTHHTALKSLFDATGLSSQYRPQIPII